MQNEDAAPDSLVRIIVAGETDCEGVGPQKCLVVKVEGEDEWRLWYERIAGFEYEPGNTFELLVSKSSQPKGPADRSTIRWTLVKILGRWATN